MEWSVALQARGDREVSHAEVVELADAVAPLGGVASGIGDTAYGARILVEAGSRSEAADVAMIAFARAAAQAGLPAWPVTTVEVSGPDDDLLEDEAEGDG